MKTCCFIGSWQNCLIIFLSCIKSDTLYEIIKLGIFSSDQRYVWWHNNQKYQMNLCFFMRNCWRWFNLGPRRWEQLSCRSARYRQRSKLFYCWHYTSAWTTRRSCNIIACSFRVRSEAWIAKTPLKCFFCVLMIMWQTE